VKFPPIAAAERVRDVPRRKPRSPLRVKPAIHTVDDDPRVSAALSRELQIRYGADHRVVRATSGGKALGVLSELAQREQSRTHSPGAKQLLITAYADTGAASKEFNDIRLDYYLPKPWDPPQERFTQSSTICWTTGG
jgi:thioredoxin reductase (NADPH)